MTYFSKERKGEKNKHMAEYRSFPLKKKKP